MPYCVRCGKVEVLPADNFSVENVLNGKVKANTGWEILTFHRDGKVRIPNKLYVQALVFGLNNQGFAAGLCHDCQIENKTANQLIDKREPVQVGGLS